MRNTLVVVPSLVAVPDRSEEDLLASAALVDICTCVAVKVAYELLDDDEVCKSLLIEILSPSVFRILVVAAIESSLGLVQIV